MKQGNILLRGKTRNYIKHRPEEHTALRKDATKDKRRQFKQRVMRLGQNRWATQQEQIMDNKTKEVKLKTRHTRREIIKIKRK